MDSKSYRYFAFISYNRKNLNAAEFIHRTLEHFRYPQESIAPDRRPTDPKYVRDIFLDKSYLSGRGELFEKQLENALAGSRYLIVICSPEAAAAKEDGAKHYVNWEIETFLKIHGQKALSRIIPVICKGEPDLSANSCLPSPIRLESVIQRNLPDMRPAGGKKLTFWNRRNFWFQAVITLLTYVFDVERSIIFDRFEAERAKLKTRIAIAASLVIVLFIALAGWFSFREYQLRTEAEQRKKELQFTEEQKQDAIARISFNEALKLTGHNNPGANRTLALIHLTNAWRLPEARRRAQLLLRNSSWLIPVEVLPGQNMPEIDIYSFSLDAPPALTQNIPDKYPANFTFSLGKLEAFLTAKKQLLWSKNNQWGIHSLNISPDGRYMTLLKTMPRFAVETYDPFTGKLLWLKELEDMPLASAFTPDGLRFAVLQQDMILKIFRNDNGNNEFEYCKLPEHTWKIEFTADSAGILAVSALQTVRYTLLLQPAALPFLSGWQHPVTAYRLSPSRKILALSGRTDLNGNASILLYNADTLQKKTSIDLDVIPHVMAISNDDRLLAAACDKTFIVYDISVPEKIRQLSRHTLPHRPDELHFSGDSQNCFIAGESNTLWCWERAAGNCMPTKISDSRKIQSIALPGNGEIITCGQSLIFRDAKKNIKLREAALPGLFEKILAVKDYIICASRLSRQVAVYSAKGEKLWQTIPYSAPGVIPFAVQESSGLIAIAVSRNTVRCFELATGKPVTEKISEKYPVTALEFCVSAKNNTPYLFIGSGDNQKGKFSVYDVTARDMIFQADTGTSSTDCFLALNNDLVFISGIGNSDHFIFELPSFRQYSVEVLKKFLPHYSGLTVNADGISEEYRTRDFKNLPVAKIFPAAMVPVSERTIGKINISNIISAAAEVNYRKAVEVLHTLPDDLTGMKEYWLATARAIAEKNHPLLYPGVSAEQFKQQQANFSASDWAVFIFADPQARFFADNFTARMVKRYKDNDVAQKERAAFERLTAPISEASTTAIDQEKERIRNTWQQMLASPRENNIEKINSTTLFQLTFNCRNIADVQKHLDETALLIGSSRDMASLSVYHRVSLADTVSKIITQCHYLPGGRVLIDGFLQKLIAAVQKAKPEGMAKQLLFDLEISAAENHLFAGNIPASQKSLLSANNYADASLTASLILPYMNILHQIAAGKTSEADSAWEKYLNIISASEELAAVMSKNFWQALELFKQNGTDIGKLEQKRLIYRRKFHTGVVIKVLPDSPAAAMGWQNNDRIMEFAGYPVSSPEELASVLFATKTAGNDSKTVSVKLKQKDGEKTFSVDPRKKIGFAY